MSDTRCNGWQNYATWKANLEVLSDVVESWDRGRQQFASVGDMADALGEALDEALTNYGELTEGIALDWARSFARDVSYYEIAEHAAEDHPALIESDDEEDEGDTWRYAVRVESDDVGRMVNESHDGYVEAQARADELAGIYSPDCTISVIDGSDFGTVYMVKGHAQDALEELLEAIS